MKMTRPSLRRSRCSLPVLSIGGLPSSFQVPSGWRACPGEEWAATWELARVQNSIDSEGASAMLFGFNGRATRNFIALLVLMHFILFVDRVNLAAAAPVIQQDLGLSNIALGLAFSAFNYAYAPFQLVGGWIADRFGARRTLAVCGLTWSITTMVTGAVSGLASLFSVRLVLGMGEGATLPAATRALSNWTSLASRGVAVGITHAAGRLGAGASAPIVAFLIAWFSWRVSFVVVGAC